MIGVDGGSTITPRDQTVTVNPAQPQVAGVFLTL
jgi:hypothetical protein